MSAWPTRKPLQESQRRSFVSKAIRRALTEAGAKPSLYLELPEIGPTLNNLRSGKWKDSHAHRDRMVEATDKALGASLLSRLSSPSDPGTTTD